MQSQAHLLPILNVDETISAEISSSSLSTKSERALMEAGLPGKGIRRDTGADRYTVGSSVILDWMASRNSHMKYLRAQR